MTKAKNTIDKPVGPPEAAAALLGELFTYYRVRWYFLTGVWGSTPADPDVITKWLEARQPRVKPAGALSIEEINEEVLVSLERGEGEITHVFGMLMFPRVGGELVQRAATERAHMKDCARVLSSQYIGRIQGERAFSTRVINGVYPPPDIYWTFLCRRDGTHITEPDGTRDLLVHTRGPRGEPINALKRVEYVDRPMMEFTLKVLGRSVSETDLHHLFEYGGTHGYGGERGNGEGRYTYELEKISADDARRYAAQSGCPYGSDPRGAAAKV